MDLTGFMKRRIGWYIQPQQQSIILTQNQLHPRWSGSLIPRDQRFDAYHQVVKCSAWAFPIIHCQVYGQLTTVISRGHALHIDGKHWTAWLVDKTNQQWMMARSEARFTKGIWAPNSNIVNPLRPRKKRSPFCRWHFQMHFFNEYVHEVYEFWSICHWSLFPRVQLTIFQHWFR